ncbi:hypothetical protein RhiirA1_469427 [Rhizophagus irregularis]|uniref:Uncharacterized protein n=1 Tax=Rhizophagus irregularis TaxID=588596 RepID=A0A2I1DRP4_9GLOM|nr:hypothetical protein RhiirA1_469427 [Rhizophagus irregularis]PKY12552.1 hypothetical protein RhiirB3_424235 [Rhizophagus irregularis]
MRRSNEVIVNIGLGLDGFFGFELIPKNSDVDEFNFEGKLRSVKSERKVYVIALIIVIVILPCNIKIEIRTDVDIIEIVTMLVKDDKAGMQKTIQDVKIPAIKKELVSVKRRSNK